MRSRNPKLRTALAATLTYKRTYALAFLLLSALPVGQAAADVPTLFPSDPALATPIDLRVELPLRKIRSSKLAKAEEFPAILHLSDGTKISLKISARGKSRRARCEFPPLRLNFAKAGAQGTLFEGQNKLKLVTHCKKGMASGPYLASEMLAYRVFNLLTGRSFRVRALNITYVDTANGRAESRAAFVIEHKKQLAARLGFSESELERIKIKELDPSHAALVSTFQYMIGNTDYSLRQPAKGDRCCHNVVAFTADADGPVVGVPYDFDASGLVNAPYAEPPRSLGIRSVTQRAYRGYCAHNAALNGALSTIADKKQEILALVSSFTDIPGLKPKRVLRYFNGYFDAVEGKRRVDRELVRRCR